MKMRTALIGFDLDGTLLTTEKRLTEYTKDVLKRAYEKGILLVPATGRPLSGIPGEVLDLPGVRYVISANGGRIIDTKQQRLIYEELVPPDTARKILEIFGRYDALREIYYDGVGYAQEDFLKNISRYMEHPPMAEYVLNTRRPVPDIMAKFEKENRGVDKVQGLFVSVEDRDRALADMRDVRDVSVTGALEKNIEVNAAGVNKGTALKILGELLHIRPEDIMAFGDASNDLAMIQAVGTGVAMENGIEEVKQAADHVAPPNDADGVARFIEAYVLNEGGRVIC